MAGPGRPAPGPGLGVSDGQGHATRHDRHLIVVLLLIAAGLRGYWLAL